MRIIVKIEEYELECVEVYFFFLFMNWKMTMNDYVKNKKNNKISLIIN